MNLIKENEDICIKEYKGFEYLQFKKLLSFGIKHCYTLKNENWDFAENSKIRNESLDILSKALEINSENIIRPLQSHTDNIISINNIPNNNILEDVDGLITDKESLSIITRNADCILLLFYDPKKRVIANIHSGWKGTLKKIGEKAVQKMIEEYKCKPEDINCFICPSIRKCHFEVDEDVKKLFEKTFEGLYTKEFIFKGDIIEGKQKYYIDTVKINKILFKKLGLKEENIIDSNICSVCNNDKIHSFRIEKELGKRAVALITL